MIYENQTIENFLSDLSELSNAKISQLPTDPAIRAAAIAARLTYRQCVILAEAGIRPDTSLVTLVNAGVLTYPTNEQMLAGQPHYITSQRSSAISLSELCIDWAPAA